MKFRPARIALCVGLVTAAPIGVSSIAQAQDADAATQKFESVLKQIENVRLATAQRRLMTAQQKANIDNIRSQIRTVPETKKAVRGIVTEMVAEIEKVIESDLPFRKEERFARLDRMRATLADDSAGAAELYRRAITLYDIEANYGYTISAYTGDHPKSPGRRLNACRENLDSSVCNLSKDQRQQLDAGLTLDNISDSIKDGNYVHFGRLSFIYLDLDSREGLRWSKDANDWEPLSSGDIINARRSVRIARGESCLLYTSPSPRDATLSRMPSSA